MDDTLPVYRLAGGAPRYAPDDRTAALYAEINNLVSEIADLTGDMAGDVIDRLVFDYENDDA